MKSKKKSWAWYKKAFRAGEKIILDAVLAAPLGFVIGPKLEVNHIWPPTSYTKKPSTLHYWLIERPLAERGVFLPKQSPKDGSAFKTFNDEHKTIERLTSSIKTNEYFVDIGAGDGIDMSNTYLLAANGWRGLSLEIDKNKFAMMATTYQRYPDVSLVRCEVNPDNILPLLEYAKVPYDFGVLNIDIDGYDYYVLEAVLKKYRPQIIVAEINPMIPANILFSIKYSESFMWSGNTWFQGMSLAMLDKLAQENGYRIVEVNKCAAFLMPQEIAPTPERSVKEWDTVIAELCDYVDASLRTRLNASSEEAMRYVSELFEGEDKGAYSIEIAK